MRQPLIVANWKMYKTRSEAKDFIEDLKKSGANKERRVEVGICPPFTLLETMGRLLEKTGIALGAQNMHWEKEGAFTGEISPLMLKDLNCSYVIIGHSERRQLFKETNEMISKKITAAFNYEITPILCVGETLEEREKGKTFLILEEQLQKALLDLMEIKPLVLAYEPVWAIGTGKNATPAEAEEAISFLRELLRKIGGLEVAENTRILYGGSVKPDNIRSFMEKEEIDGALVGGASLDAQSFASIVEVKL